MPDNWSNTTHSLNNTNNSGASYGSNSINASTWNNTFKPAGAVFLPAAGYRYGTSVFNVGSGSYWSDSSRDSYYAYGVYFSGGDLYAGHWSSSRRNGFSVRLVRPAE